MRAAVVLSLVLTMTQAASAHPLLPGTDPCGDDVPCAIRIAYASDAAAQKHALELYDKFAAIPGVGPEEDMDGGYRGTIHLVPQLPVGARRKHLVWVLVAMRDIEHFFVSLFPRGDAKYRWRDISFRFVRSVGKRTPSAYAMGFTIEYNVEGSLLTSRAGAEETLFHELFHANDDAHDDWSVKALRDDYRAIVAKCGTKVACLAPYAPNDTRVRGGTYYAFQPDNGESVHEYAAELAVRYWNEQREMMEHEKLRRPAFKCGPPENARAWAALIAEFFAGVDLVPPCA